MTERLERLRDRAHNQMLNIMKFAEKLNEDTSIEDITTRLETLDVRYQAFNEQEVQLFEFPNYVPITDEVDNLYYKTRALLAKASNRSGRENAPHDLNNTLEQFIDQQKTFYEGVNTSKHVRLPKINIEQFSGDYKHWASFYDLFRTTVHSNTHISNVHKFQMLRSYLSSEAAALIRHIPITEGNYTEAWKKLCSRYNKTTPIVTSLIQSFLEQKPAMNTGKELRNITEKADEIIRGLRALGPNAEKRDPWLIHIMLSKIDNETKQLWANQSVATEFPTFEDLLLFLNKRCDALEICDATTKKPVTRANAKSFFTATPNTSFNCIICEQNHPLFKCPVFKNKNVNDRAKIVTDRGLCRNCLKGGHMTTKCYTKFSCRLCAKRHHTLLHEGDTQPGSNQSSTNHHTTFNDLETKSSNDSEDNDESRNTTQVLYTTYSSPTTVLPTAIVYVKSRIGELQLCRALLDSGSQTSFVTEHCAQRLGLKRNQSSLFIYGLASASTGKTKGRIDMTITSLIDIHYNINVTAHIINNITNMLPTKPLSFNKNIVGLQLADPQFFKPSKIDLLLGADVFFEILHPEQRIIDGFPKLQSSKLGWLIAGTFNNPPSTTLNFYATPDPVIQTTNDDLYQLLHKFWEVEEVAPVNTNTQKHLCEVMYEETTTRDPSGRLIVKLPFKQPRPSLGNSFEAAYQRLKAMERKFAKRRDFFEAYKSFMDDYIRLGHMTYVPEDKVPISDDEKYFLPHHAVIKAGSSTTKLRVVFDGSCKSRNGVSLNDILHVGPNIQTDLSKIILRFRKPAIALVADIEKMYRQIRVDSDDANYQIILWRDQSDEQIKLYRLNTVTYGTACAPYLAIKSLKQSSNSFRGVFPQATHVINNDFYIDDMLTGCDSVAEAIQLKEQVTKILLQSRFNLRKWKSNSTEFLSSFSKHEIENIPKLIEDDECIKTLGILWNSESDTFSFKVQPTANNVKWTKRKILSTASKVYDPLGWLAPTVILFKILLQKIWLLKVEWDASLPEDISLLWEKIYQSLHELEKIHIPRRFTKLQEPKELQLHGFCDASEAAYGCVIYLRAVNDHGTITTNIVYSKSKVAPLKQISLPRLELCGAALLCKSMKWCIASLEYEQINIFAWTDSMIVLHWLSDFPRRWTSFIGNRTSAILEVIPRSKWQHVDSKSNPADIITRGINPIALSTSQQWWYGPQWLSDTEHNWPKPRTINVSTENEQLEQRAKYINVLTSTKDADDVVSNLLIRFSSWYKIRRILVYVLRFMQAHRKPKQNQQNSAIPTTEMNEAESIVLRNVQKVAFFNELRILKLNASLPAKHELSSLDPFVDSSGLLRVGGRLKKSSLPYSAKHPIILPKNHAICQLIIRDIHTNHMHAGNSLTLCIVRNKYWIMGARNMIKHCLKTCIVCIRYRSQKIVQKMADLPAVRCNQGRPFSKIGLDYAGPLYIKIGKRKTAQVEKAYVAVFVCLAVKAVHLEVVSSLDTESFLAALKRFISRRGIPSEIWCDNGSNFIGANRELRQLKQQIIHQTNNPLISDFLLQKSILFNFIPPQAPHFGGLWEAAVKSFKYHFKRVTNTNLTFEEVTTLVIQIEGLLNSRPLCKITDDPADLEMLTPAHFLVGEALTVVPEPSLAEVKTNKLSKWQNVQQRVQGFWNRWHQDYLSTLQYRHKWKSTQHQFQVDDVVLIREDNLPPSNWMMGRITTLHSGSDGITRVVTLKTIKNEVKRPVNRLIRLPIKE